MDETNVKCDERKTCHGRAMLVGSEVVNSQEMHSHPGVKKLQYRRLEIT